MEKQQKQEKMTLASQPEILRSTQRDSNFKSYLNFKLLEVLEQLVKYNIITKYE